MRILRTTAQMVETQDLNIASRRNQQSPVPYMLRMTASVTCALTIAGGSWYVAIRYTTETDLTAIYNCSAFFAYAFSIPLLGDKLKFGKVFAVALAIAGVLTVCYGDRGTADGDKIDSAENRTLGNIIIGIGSVLYGLYEVLYKKLACPPEGTSAGRSEYHILPPKTVSNIFRYDFLQFVWELNWVFHTVCSLVSLTHLALHRSGDFRAAQW